MIRTICMTPIAALNFIANDWIFADMDDIAMAQWLSCQDAKMDAKSDIVH